MEKVRNPGREKFRSFLGQRCQNDGRELGESWDLGEAWGRLLGEDRGRAVRNLAEDWERVGRKLGEGAEAARRRVGACWQKL